MRSRWGRPTAVGLTATFAVIAVLETVSLLATPWGQGLIASDIVQGYLPAASRFLATGSPYLPAQVAGPWQLGVHSFIHPPIALALFVPYLYLPLALWWIVPVGLVTAALRRLNPSDWAWPVMAACLVWPRSVGSVVAGNTDVWAMAAVAAGSAWGWPVVLLAVKPTLAPLAVVAIRRRSAWIGAVIVAMASVAMLPLWIDWLHVIANAGLSWTYSLANLPLVAAPAVAWLARRRT